MPLAAGPVDVDVAGGIAVTSTRSDEMEAATVQVPAPALNRLSLAAATRRDLQRSVHVWRSVEQFIY